MKVLIVSGGKPTADYPLNGNFEFDQAVALAAAGLDIIFFAVDLRSLRRKRRLGISHGKEKGVSWYEISIPVGRVPISLLCFIGGKALCYLFNQFFKSRTEYPNIIHAHFTEVGCMAASLSKKYNIPLVITEHSSAMNSPVLRSGLLKCAKKGYTQASKVIAVSGPLRESIIRNISVEPCVIHNMIRLDTFAHANRFNHSGFNFVSTGALIPRKRFSNLIKAFTEIAKKHDDIFLHIIGDGPMKADLIKISQEFGMSKRIIFYGYKNSKEIADIFGKCDCFVLATARETFGVVYAEAMAVGLPVIATRCGGPEDFVTKENGILVDVDNQLQLLNAIEYMYKNVSNYKPDEIRFYVRNNFSPEVISKKIINIYNNVES